MLVVILFPLVAGNVLQAPTSGTKSLAIISLIGVWARVGKDGFLVLRHVRVYCYVGL